MNTNKTDTRAEGVAYLNKCFEMGVTWANAKRYTKNKFHVVKSTVEKWREYTKYYQP